MSRRGASAAILSLAEHGFVEAVVPEAATEQIRRNLARLLPAALPAFEEFLVLSGFRVHAPSADDLARARPCAHARDVAILAAAIGAGAPVLVTHNVKHFRGGAGVEILRPRDYVKRLRADFEKRADA
jgi:hypothetical protein